VKKSKVIKLKLNSEEDNYQHRWIITYLLRDRTLEICLAHPKMLRKTLFLSFILSISVCHSQQNPNYRILPYSVNPVQYDRSPSISHKKEQDGFDLKQVNIHSLMKALFLSTVNGNTQIVHDDKFKKLKRIF